MQRPQCPVVSDSAEAESWGRGHKGKTGSHLDRVQPIWSCNQLPTGGAGIIRTRTNDGAGGGGEERLSVRRAQTVETRGNVRPSTGKCPELRCGRVPFKLRDDGKLVDPCAFCRQLARGRSFRNLREESSKPPLPPTAWSTQPLADVLETLDAVALLEVLAGFEALQSIHLWVLMTERASKPSASMQVTIP